MSRPVNRIIVAAFALAGLSALAGCVASRVDWSKPGASETDLQQDLSACHAEAINLAPQVYDPRTMGVISDPQETSRLAAACMTGRGWQLMPRTP